MRFILERVSDPEIEPVTLAEARRQVREFDDVTTNDDDLIKLIKAAREWAERYTGRVLVDQTWRLTIADDAVITGDAVSGYENLPPSCWSAFNWWRNKTGEILLRKSPIITVSSFVTVDSAGDETTIDVDTYEVRESDSKWPRLVALDGASWIAGTFRITYRAGYADQTGSPQDSVDVIPECFHQAIKLYVEALYNRDEKMMPLLLETAENLIRGERCELGMA